MKAILSTEYGSPEVLRLEEVEKPAPNDDQMLVRVRAAALNPADWHVMHGPLMARAMGTGLRRPKDPRVGIDFAGTVETAGRNVQNYAPGDAVYGGCDGALAEYVCVSEKSVAPKPIRLSFEEAAAVPVAALTALQGLRDSGRIKEGESVLVNGASGGVGTFAVQIAKSYGAAVTGVCSTRNLELVRSLGAAHAIDYTKEDFTRSEQHYDLIFDAVGNHSVLDLARALEPDGRCVVAGYTSLLLLLQHILFGKLYSRFGRKQVGMMGIAKVRREDLAYMNGLMEQGKVVPVIDRCYQMAEAVQAMAHLGTKHARGKIVIVVSDSART